MSLVSDDSVGYLLIRQLVERASYLELENILLRTVIDEKDHLLEVASEYMERVR